MSYYNNLWGKDTKFTLRGKDGKILAETYGKRKNSEPLQLKNPPAGFESGYPAFELITVNRVTEMIEHRKMEPIFYITDDPAVWNELVGVRPTVNQ